MNNIFEKLQLEKPVRYNDYLRVTIALESNYTDGHGWDSIQAQQEFAEDVYRTFKAAGYQIDHSEQKWGSCPYLRSHDEKNRLELYMHPQAFTGYVDRYELDKIMEILSDCKCIQNPRIHYSEPVYDMSDKNYHDYLLDHSDQIIACIQDAVLKGIHVPNYEIGFEFAECCRIPRVGDGAGRSYDDVDVQTVRDIYRIAEINHLLDKDYILQHRPQKTESEKYMDALNALGEGYADRLKGTEFICTLPEFLQYRISLSVQHEMMEWYNTTDPDFIVHDNMTLTEAVNDVMCGRLVDLEDHIDWRDLLKGGDGILIKEEEREEI